jgi:mannonate dehydratase
MEVIESVNIHEDIKKGLPTRDRYIENYLKILENLSKIAIKCLCYNFMPVIDWARSDLAVGLPDGSTAMAYRHEQVLKLNPVQMAAVMDSQAWGYSLPVWEPERLDVMAADIEFYQSVMAGQYWSNLQYFLDAVIPAAEKYEIKMAIHPDDPPWPLYGLTKLITDAVNLRTFLALNESPCNGLTFCTGSLGANPDNDLPGMAEEFAAAGRIHFAHLRNIKRLSKRDFDEAAHIGGDLNLFKIIEALHHSGFDGYIRPDHGRMIWDEKGRPGYGLYDRALGANYLYGLWEAIAQRKK